MGHSREHLARRAPLLVLAAYILIIPSASDDLAANHYLLVVANIVAAFSLYRFYSQPTRRRAATVLVRFLVLRGLFVLGRTMVALISDLFASRRLGTQDNDPIAASSVTSFAGAGGYRFVYSLPPPTMLGAVSLRFAPRPRPVALLSIVLLGIVLLRISYTVAIPLLSFGLLFLVEQLLSNRGAGKVAVPLALVGAPRSLVALAGLPPALRWLASTAYTAPIFASRTDEFPGIIQGETTGGAGAAGLTAHDQDSWMTFLHHPSKILGVDDAGTAVGGHSARLGTVASIGLFTIVVLRLLARAFSRTLTYMPGVSRLLVYSYWGYLLTLGVVSTPFSSDLSRVWLFFVSLSLVILGDRDEVRVLPSRYHVTAKKGRPRRGSAVQGMGIDSIEEATERLREPGVGSVRRGVSGGCELHSRRMAVCGAGE